ncbi:MAG: hypothetical protein CL775_06620 [Chloroflexi bacterium]|uniref:Uncharacterized protein n=1 Tax=marine metagenome TaxID=408172 RepID=A0A383BE81_9ZZZZ|nr:hypothetical protein [Chloroflexota bacterium]|tara:strand:+ start:4218 stop:4415 length:198 start_codon:yes stop_codon:yes gene_type:complete
MDNDKINIIEKTKKIVDPWEDYINENFDNLSWIQKNFIRPFIVLFFSLGLLLLFSWYLLVKTGQW